MSDLVDGVYNVSVSKETLVKWSEHLVRRAKAESIDETLKTVHRETAERKHQEDIRANKRNFNRMLMLFGALLIGIVVSYVLSNPGAFEWTGVPESTFHMLAPYAFVITIFFDSALALYSYVKKY